jgi:hypothetical protein
MIKLIFFFKKKIQTTKAQRNDEDKNKEKENSKNQSKLSNVCN